MDEQRLSDYAAFQAAQRGDAAFHEMQPDELLADIELHLHDVHATELTKPQWWREFTVNTSPTPPKNGEGGLSTGRGQSGTDSADRLFFPDTPFFSQITRFFQDGAHPADVIPHVFNFLHLTSLSHPEIALTLLEIPTTRLSCAKGHTHTADHRCALIHIDQPNIDNPDDFHRIICGLSAHCHQILRDAIDEGRLAKTSTNTRTGDSSPDTQPADSPQPVRLATYLLAGGPSIRHIMRRAYFLAKGWFPDAINGAALRVLADLSGETKQNWSGYALKLREELEATGIITDCAVKYAKKPSARATYKISAKEGWETRRKRQDDLRILN
jgi:hypothetical protein